MDGANLSEGGDGDSAAKEANRANTNARSPGDQDVPEALSDAERMHEENAKRFKMDVADFLDKIGIVIDNEAKEKANFSGGSGSTSSFCEASTSSCDNSTAEKETESQTAPSEAEPTTASANKGSKEKKAAETPSTDTPHSELSVPPSNNASEDSDAERDRMRATLERLLSDNDNDNVSDLFNDEEDDDDDDDEFHDSPLTLRLSDQDSDEDEKPAVLLKPKPKHNWFIIPEIVNRQFGTSANRQAAMHFQQRCYGSLHCVERLELMYKMDKHLGCVNALNFHPNGTWLASGSDDLEIIIWDWKMGNPLLSFESKHRSNVFQSKFMPLSGNDLHIVTCARDGQIRLAQVSAQEGFRSSRKLGTHRGPSHKLTVLKDQPQVVISVGEDGVVLKHDLRCSKSDKVLTVQRDEAETVALYSISSNPLNSNEYCVAGRDYQVRTYDLRKANKGNSPLAFYHPFETVGDLQKHLHVTCAVYNHNGSEILASYNDEDIYLMDVSAKEGKYIHSYQGHRNGATIKGVSFFGPQSEFVISGSDCGYVYFWEKDSEAIVQFLRADYNGVVNCLEPHPQLPFLCTSGLDRDIKVWVPSYEEDPKMEDLTDTVKQNLKERNNWSTASSSEVENARVLWMLWRQFNTNTTELLRRIPASADVLSNQSSSSSSSESHWSSSSEFTSSASEHDSDSDANEGPIGCSPS